MSLRLPFFDNIEDVPSSEPIQGLRYKSELINSDEEGEILSRLSKLPFREFEFHGYPGKRRVVSFGYRYDYSGNQIRRTDEIPEFLLPLRAAAAAFAGLEQNDLQAALVTEYQAGTGIGWHRDKAVFGNVVGVSLLSRCTLRFRKKIEPKTTTGVERRKQFERVNVAAEPRSAYLLSGPARHVWEHSILRVDALRYAITFREVRRS